MKKCYTLLIATLFSLLRVYGQPLTPDQIPNLSLWLRADSVVKNINNNVSSWINCVGGPDFMQLDSAKQPRWISNAICGTTPVIRFDGVNDFLNAGDNYDLGTKSRTVFILSKANDSVFALYAKSTGNSTANRYALVNLGRGVTLIYFDNQSRVLQTTTSHTGFNVLCNTIDRDSQEIKLFQNGVQLGATIGGMLGPMFNFSSAFRFLLGAHNGPSDIGEDLHLNGDMVEMIVYDSVLPDTTRNKIELYLYAKYDSCSFTTNVVERYNGGFALSPNPATTSVTLQLEQTPSSSTTFQLFDITGRMILQKPLTETTNRVELSGVSKGMYLYNVVSDKERLGTGKLIVEP
ncbi:MAG: T9SS type A sorting domain-containing protein [Bacteroidota bacterium]